MVYLNRSDGAHLALWRPRRLSRAAQRAGFVADALQIYRALARTAATWNGFPDNGGTTRTL